MGLESMRIVTGCRTPEQFVALFHRFCDAKSCFIPTTDTRPVGSTLAFSLRLADGTSMLRGMCLVTASWNDGDNAFARPGVQLEIQKLTPDSVDVFEALLAQNATQTDGIVEEVVRTDTNQHVPRETAMRLLQHAGLARPVDDKETIEMPPLFAETDARAPIKTLLGVAPLTAAIVSGPIVDEPTHRVPSMAFRLRAVSEAIVPLLRPRDTRTTASVRPLHAMTACERTWFLAAFGAVLLLAALVVGSAVVSAG